MPVGMFGSENEAVGVSLTPSMMSECSVSFTGGKLYWPIRILVSGGKVEFEVSITIDLLYENI